MDTCTILRLFIFQSLTFVAKPAIVISPINTLLLLPSELVINCTSDNAPAAGISYNRLNADGTVAQDLFGCTGFGTAPQQYRFEATANTCALFVDAVTPTEAGQYECYIFGPPEEKASAAVVVLTSPPTLNVTGSNANYTTGENVTLEYTVDYVGDMTPELVWASEPVIRTIDIIPVVSSGQITYSITITSDTGGDFTLSCGVRFTVNGVTVTDQSDVSYDSNSEVTVTFFPVKTAQFDSDCNGLCDWELALIIVFSIIGVVGICVLIGCGIKQGWCKKKCSKSAPSKENSQKSQSHRSASSSDNTTPKVSQAEMEASGKAGYAPPTSNST